MAEQRPSFLWAEEAGSLPETDRLCPTCGDVAPKGTICRASPGADRPWALLRCAACGCGFYADQSIPDYAAPEMAGVSPVYYFQQGAGVAIFANVLARIQKPAGATYVEVGCGFGFALDVAVHAMGWHGRGMDPAIQAEIGRDMLGLDIALAYFDPTTVADGSCDIVMATEVLEHLPDPVGFLAEIRRGLKPDGVVVLTTPDVAAVAPPQDKRALSATLSVGLHLILHSAESLAGALRAAGFPHVKVETNGWQLAAFGSAVPLALRDDAADLQARVNAYLAERAGARATPDDLYFGYAGRALFEGACSADWATAGEVWPRLDRALRDRYGIAVDDIVAPPPGSAGVSFEALPRVMPFNLPPILLARAYQRLQAGTPRPQLRARFAAIETVCAPILAALAGRGLRDPQIEHVMWRARAEALLCAADARDADVIRLADLPESPDGGGRLDYCGRAIVTLFHMERPYLAARLARAAGLPAARRAGDLSSSGLAKAYLRERLYRIRQSFRAA
jgi:SAM-dependent methyltransferase